MRGLDTSGFRRSGGGATLLRALGQSRRRHFRARPWNLRWLGVIESCSRAVDASQQVRFRPVLVCVCGVRLAARACGVVAVGFGRVARRPWREHRVRRADRPGVGWPRSRRARSGPAGSLCRPRRARPNRGGRLSAYWRALGRRCRGGRGHGRGRFRLADVAGRERSRRAQRAGRVSPRFFAARIISLIARDLWQPYGVRGGPRACASSFRGLAARAGPLVLCPDLYHPFLPRECKYQGRAWAVGSDEETSTK
jgi:hypothetical protein